MKREPELVDDYANQPQRSFNTDLASYTTSICSRTSPAVGGQVPITAFSQPGAETVRVCSSVFGG